MCDPVTALLVVGTAFSVKGQMNQASYQKKVGENNAIAQEFAAKDAMDRGRIEEDRQRTKNRQTLGAQEAALAANGIDTSTGTGLNLMTDSAGSGEMDALTIRNNAVKQAYGLEAAAGNSRADANAGASALRTGAYGSLLTAGSAAYGAYNKAGAPKAGA
jgi:hypothetical protein